MTRCYKRFDAASAGRAATHTDAAETYWQLQWCTVKSSTRRQYESALGSLASFLAAARGIEPATELTDRLGLAATCSEDDFILFAHARKEAGCSSLALHRSALLLLQTARRVTPFAGEPHIARLDRAVAAAADRPEKGCVTPAMLEDLCRMLEKSDRLVVSLAARLAFGAALRIGELRRLQRGDLQNDVEGTACLMLRIAKGERQGQPQFVVKTVPATLLDVWRRTCELRYGEADFLLPKNIGTDLSNALLEASKTLRWPEGVLWKGTHQLRIGGATAIAARTQQALGAACVGHSVGVFKQYARGNTARKRPRE